MLLWGPKTLLHSGLSGGGSPPFYGGTGVRVRTDVAAWMRTCRAGPPGMVNQGTIPHLEKMGYAAENTIVF